MIFPIKTELFAPSKYWVTYFVFNNKNIHYDKQQIYDISHSWQLL